MQKSSMILAETSIFTGNFRFKMHVSFMFQLFGGGGAIDPWDGNFRSFLKNASRSQLLVDWIVLRYPQDTVGDYVMENMLDVGIFPRFNPRSEMRWDKKDEPFMQY